MEIFSLYFGCFILCVMAMKGVSLLVTDANQSNKFFFKTPYLSPLTLNRKNADGIQAKAWIWLTYLVCTITTLKINHLYLPEIDSEIAKSYLLLPAIYFSLELLGRTAALVFSLISNTQIVDMHNAPWSATSLKDFWGNRWNLWVRDWILMLSKRRAKYGAKNAMLFAFLLSGFFHEIMVAIPYYLLTKKSVFGMMLLYFSVQFIGMQFEKRFLTKKGFFIRFIFTWLFIIVPIPLFINSSVIYFYGL